MKEKIEQIAKYYGYEAQSRQLIEEMAELTVAINKIWRRSNNHLRDKKLHEYCQQAIEEIADVEIMLEQIKYLVDCASDVEEVKRKKIERQLERMKNYE